MRVAGIMSGTSLDGIDVAIVDIAGRRIRTIAHHTTAYPPKTRARILAAATPAEISRLNFELGELYAKAVAAIGISVGLAGCHGQTIYHEGGRNTLQVGEASVIAERLGVPVVSGFRTRDIAAGGQGAPLVPFVDVLLFSHPKRRRVALNIGGIANITIIPTGVAFDTGPGNMVIDQLTELMSKGRQRFDRDGQTAARGRVNRALLASLLDPKGDGRYYAARPPKSAGREQYGAAFVERFLALDIPFEDRIATATALTAATIARAVPADTDELIASGGGVHNDQLMAQLAAFLPGTHITTTAEFGIHPDAKEAVAFAILAYRTWKHQTGNLPSATGARRPVILGSLTLK